MNERNGFNNHPSEDDLKVEARFREWKELLIRAAQAMEHLGEDVLLKEALIKMGIRVEMLPLLRDFNAGTMSEDELAIRGAKLAATDRNNQ